MVEKSRHNIYLSDEGDGNHKVVVKGNDLNLRWFNNSILIWTGDNSPIVKDILEIVEKAIKGEFSK